MSQKTPEAPADAKPRPAPPFPASKVPQFFQALSYLQYPFMLTALGYTLVPYFNGFQGFWSSVNTALIFAGLGLSFSTLQDTRKTQNDFSKRIWQDPKKGRRALILIALTALLLLLTGMYGFLTAREGVIKEVGFGMLMLGIGQIGLLKAAMEMHERHRIDR